MLNWGIKRSFAFSLTEKKKKAAQAFPTCFHFSIFLKTANTIVRFVIAQGSREREKRGAELVLTGQSGFFYCSQAPNDDVYLYDLKEFFWARSNAGVGCFFIFRQQVSPCIMESRIFYGVMTKHNRSSRSLNGSWKALECFPRCSMGRQSNGFVRRMIFVFFFIVVQRWMPKHGEKATRENNNELFFISIMIRWCCAPSWSPIISVSHSKEL